MDDLRWVLLIFGVVVVAGVYFSSRFEKEAWKRERGARQSHHEDHAVKKEKPSPHQQQNPVEVVPADESDTQTTRVSAENATADSIVSKAAPIAVAPKSAFSQKIEPTFSDVPQNNENEATDKRISSEQVDKDQSHEIVDSDNLPHENLEHEHIVTVDIEADDGLEPEAGDWESVLEESNLIRVEDEIVPIEIPDDIASVVEMDNIADTKHPDPMQAELALDIEPLVLVMSVMAGEDKFDGDSIREALEAEGLEHGDMKIFHYHVANKRDAVFSVASILEPGYFELDKLSEFATPGLMLFCQLPGPVSANEAFDTMLDKARGLSVRLHGKLCDEKRNKLTPQAIAHYRDRITNYLRMVELAKKKKP